MEKLLRGQGGGLVSEGPLQGPGCSHTGSAGPAGSEGATAGRAGSWALSVSDLLPARNLPLFPSLQAPAWPKGTPSWVKSGTLGVIRFVSKPLPGVSKGWSPCFG